jgi:hypothetical protein
MLLRSILCIGIHYSRPPPRSSGAKQLCLVMHGHLCASWTARPFHVLGSNAVRFFASVGSLYRTAALLGAHGGDWLHRGLAPFQL